MSELKATHQCTICGARWRELDDFRWNLRSKECGPCCDNVPMGDQIEALEDVALWSGPLTAEEQGVIDDAWQTHKAATPPPASADALGEVETLLDEARHEMTVFDRPSKRTTLRLIETLEATAALSAMSPAGEVERLRVVDTTEWIEGLRDRGNIPDMLLEVANQVEHWLAWSANRREREGLSTDGETHIMSLPVPTWPTFSQFEHWIALFKEAAREMETRHD